MKLRQLYLPAFVLMALVQFYVPFQMILDKEEVLDRGAVYAFECAPVDPADPFRGRYIDLQFAENEVRVPGDRPWQPGDLVYLHLDTYPDGRAKVAGASFFPPEGESAYLQGQVQSAYQEEDSLTLQFLLPFDRFYLQEFLARPAEEVYRRSLATDTSLTVALVKVLDGQGVVVDVQIDGRSIRELAQEQ